MKKLYLFLLILFTSFNSKVFAVEKDTGIFGSCASKTDIRNGDVKLETIPCVLDGLIDFFMGIAGTISVIFIIIGAYQMLYGSLAKDNSKGKTTIIYAILGFVLASFSWLIIKFILDNF